MAECFDDWPIRYDQWFATPIGKLVKHYELELILDLLGPRPGELILDAGCGTGVFTAGIIMSGAHVTGLDISRPMLKQAGNKLGSTFAMVRGDILTLPFRDNCFDKVVSITALEFIMDARTAIAELFRVTKGGGEIVIATLNSLSPWAKRRMKAAKGKGGIFTQATFRSPMDMQALAPVEGMIRTAIHFMDDLDPSLVPEREAQGRKQGLDTGAFLAARWAKP